MKFYLAGSEGFYDFLKNIPEAKSLLCSYYSITQNEKKNSQIFNLYGQKDIFLDSGAFSAFTTGAKIDIDAYIDFIKRWKHKITVYCGLDVIGDAEQTYKNQLYMQKAGLMPLATFHHGEDFKYLDIYVRDYDYIALGGVAQLRGQRDKLDRWLNSCFSRIVKKKGLKVHGFAIFAPRLILKYPFYSVDATSWLSGCITGTLMIPTINNFVGVSYKDKDKILKYTKQIQRLYPNIIDLLDEKKAGKLKYYNRLRFNIIMIDQFYKLCTEVWLRRGVNLI